MLARNDCDIIIIMEKNKKKMVGHFGIPNICLGFA